MSDYLKKIVSDKENIKKLERENLCRKGNLPVLHQHGAKLAPLQEMMVKAVYLSGGMFLPDIRKMFCFRSDMQKTERTIKGLIADGYLNVRNTQYGNLYGLTKEAVAQLRSVSADEEAEPVTTVGMRLDMENSLLKHRIISGCVADYVFQKQLAILWNSYFTTDKLTRNLYLCNQYIKNICYRDYLKLTQTERRDYLLGLSVPEQEAESLSRISQYSIRNASIFADYYGKTHTFESIRATTEYRAYIAYVRKHALTQPNEDTFYLLKEMMPEPPAYRELELLTQWDCNLRRYGMENIWEKLSHELQENQLLQCEKALEQCCQYIKYLGDEKRRLIATNAYRNQTDTEALKEITEKLTVLEHALDRFHEKKEQLETDFCFSVVKSYDEDGADYEEKVITFKRLEQNAVYVGLTDPGKITFYLVQQQDDYFDPFQLHKKLSMSFQLFRRLFPLYEIKIRILTLTREQELFVEERLPSIRKHLLASRETAFLANSDDSISVCSVRTAVRERYHFFHELYAELKGETVNDGE